MEGSFSAYSGCFWSFLKVLALIYLLPAQADSSRPTLHGMGQLSVLPGQGKSTVPLLYTTGAGGPTDTWDRQNWTRAVHVQPTAGTCPQRQIREKQSLHPQQVYFPQPLQDHHICDRHVHAGVDVHEHTHPGLDPRFLNFKNTSPAPPNLEERERNTEREGGAER